MRLRRPVVALLAAALGTGLVAPAQAEDAPTPPPTSTSQPSAPSPGGESGMPATTENASASPDPSHSESVSPTPEPTTEPPPEPTRSAIVEDAAETIPTPDPEPSVEPLAQAVVPAASPVLYTGSAPGGFQMGSEYVFWGTAEPGMAVTVWWDLQAGSNWRRFATATADASGQYRIVAPIGSSARFKFAASAGHVPGTGGEGAWETLPEAVNAFPARANHGYLEAGSAPGGFQVGAEYVFMGTTVPGMPVQLWWDAEPFKGWRAWASTVADSSGNYRIVVPIGSAARFKFAVTSGHVPGQSPAEGWETQPTHVNAFPARANQSFLSAGSAPGGFRVGSHYVFSGTTVPGIPVTLWWDAQPWAGWRRFSSTEADANGNYRLVLPIGSAARFLFTATSGHSPDAATPPGGWQTTAVAVTAVDSPSSAVFSASVRRATTAELGASWRAGCPVGSSQLSVITMNHWTFEGGLGSGDLVVRSDLAPAVISIFRAAFQEQFPIRSIQTAAAFGGVDEAMMEADVTSGFNCRRVVGNPQRISPHSYGYAIDINTRENPYRAGGVWYPPSGAAYIKRTPVRSGMHTASTVFPRAFKSAGGHWGGCYSDYHHFELTTRKC